MQTSALQYNSAVTGLLSQPRDPERLIPTYVNLTRLAAAWVRRPSLFAVTSRVKSY
ncbi:hypothetical protein K440DRAFT_619016, partial [Wilcoxina mikolae CBS 423.85]